MASPGNPNQVVGGGQFDMAKFFNPSPPNPILQNPNSSNNLPSYTPPTPFSYPPPTGPYSYSPQPPQFNNHLQQHPPPVTNMLHQRSVSYPTPPLQPPPTQNPNAGAKLMALLGAPPSNLDIPQQQPAVPMVPNQPFSYGSSEFSMPPNVPVLPSMSNLNSAMNMHSGPMRMPSSKMPKGRHLIGDHVVYDIDSRLEGEVQPQLEVTPITKYVSDPGLVLGRQIAVNKTYICYGLKMGNVRVLNINTASRSLLKGLAQVGWC